MSWTPSELEARLNKIEPQTTDTILLKIMAQTLIWIAYEIEDIKILSFEKTEQPEVIKIHIPKICPDCNFPVPDYHTYSCPQFKIPDPRDRSGAV